MLKLAIVAAVVATAMAAGPVCGPGGQECSDIEWAVYDAASGLCWAYASPCNFDCSIVNPDLNCFARYGWRFGSDAECGTRPDLINFQPSGPPYSASRPFVAGQSLCSAHIFDPNHNHCDFNDANQGRWACKNNGNNGVWETFLVCDGTPDAALFTNPACDNIDTPAPTPDCDAIPGWGSEQLETTLSPILAVDASGFITTDTFTVAADVPQKFTVTQATLFSNAETAANLGPIGIECYDRWAVTTIWGDLVNANVLAREEDAAVIRFRGVLHIEMEEALQPIRGTPLTRVVISELPWEATFPKQVEAHLDSISAFDNPNNIAAIVRQEVSVDVNVPSASATIDIYTSLQWPFKSTDATISSDVPGFNAGISVALHSECGDANAGDIQNAAPGDANACNQVWRISLDVPQGVCELDGSYTLTLKAICQASFEALTDCPLVLDDLGQGNDDIVVDFILDSEYFCAQVVDDVDISASLTAYKDHDHTVDASNFVLGQTIYFKAVTSSNKATVTCTKVSEIDIMFDGSPVMHQVFANDADQNFVQSLVVEDGPAVSGINTQAWFQFLVTDGPFTPPVDGQIDYDVWIVLDVCFKDVSLMEAEEQTEKIRFHLLQAGNHATSQSVRLGVAGAADESEDPVESSAAAISGVVASVVAFAAAL